MRRFVLASAFIAALLATSASRAAIVVTVPANTILQPNTPNQMVPITVTSSNDAVDAVTAFSLNAAINSGVGPGPVFQGGGDTTGADFVTGTVWTGSGHPFSVDVNPGTTGIPLPGFNMLGQAGVSFDNPGNKVNPGGPVGGLLLTLKIDTTGSPGGTFPLTLSGVPGLNFPTSRFFDGSDMVPATFVNGQITVVPEPGAWMLCLLVGMCGLTASRGCGQLRGWIRTQ